MRRERLLDLVALLALLILTAMLYLLIDSSTGMVVAAGTAL
ncbi:hypothetical protein OHB00_49200 [Streptomyces sp. NBC_00631]